MFTFGFVIMVSTVAFAQRDIGNTRSGGEGSRSGSGERPSRTSPPAADNPSPQPSPPSSSGGVTIIVCCPSPPPVIIFEPPVNVEEKPEVFGATMSNNEGFDFSAEEICPQGDTRADVIFSNSQEGPEFIVGNDVDIQDLGQDLGQSVSFFKLESPPDEWSPTHRVHAEVHNVYVVWTWDNQFYKFRVASLKETRVAIEWMPMEGGRRIAAKDERRSGQERYRESTKFGM